MDAAKRARLEAVGGRVESVTEFLGLSPEEEKIVELRVALSKELRQRRQQRAYTQIDLADCMKSSQSRVAKMEAGDPSVSIELLLRGLFSIGATCAEVGAIIAAQDHQTSGSMVGHATVGPQA